MTNARNTGIYGRVNPGPGFGDEYSYTDDVVLTADQDGAVINNAGAAKAITVTLPAAIAGMEFSIQRIAPYGISVYPSGSEKISDGGNGVAAVLLSRGLLVVSCSADGSWEVVTDSAVWNFEQ